MGKTKSSKNKGVTFKLVYRDSEDEVGPEKTLSERIFLAIEDHKKAAAQNNDTYRQKILSQFTKEDLGQGPKKAVQTDFNHDNHISNHTKGREDLWITHVQRMKQQAKVEAALEEQENAKKIEKHANLLDKLKKQGFKKLNDKQIAKAQEKKKVEKDDKGKEEEGDEDGEWEDDEGEDGEWEDDEEDMEVEEWEEEEEEEEEEYEEFEDEELEKMVKEERLGKMEKVGTVEKVEKVEKVDTKVKGGKMEEIEVSKQPVVKFDDFPTLGGGMGDEPQELDKIVLPVEVKNPEEEKIEEVVEEDINLTKIQVIGEVRMKRYDDLGLPMDGYNYYQHIAPSNAGGAPTFAFEVQYDHVVQLPTDMDVDRNKLNAEEKELYDALDFEGEKGGYDDLDDDFFDGLIKGSHLKLEEKDTIAARALAEEKDKKEKKAKRDAAAAAATKKPKKAAVEEKEEVEEVSDEEFMEMVANKDEEEGKAKKPVTYEEKMKQKIKDAIYKKQEFQKVLKQHMETLKEKYKDEREKNKKKYKIESDTEEEELSDDIEEVESFDEENKDFVEKLPYAQDYAMQQAVIESSTDEENEHYEPFRDPDFITTKAPTEVSVISSNVPVARKANLNIIKEGGRTDKKEKVEKKEEKEKENEEEGEEESSDEEGEEDGQKVDEIFKKREKGETKEERKQRKEAVKQFKKDRKEKKKKFKETFDDKRKVQMKIAQKQAESMQGLSLYKLTV